ncbi:MAG: ketosteroid isomerase-related protein [bacterium]
MNPTQTLNTYYDAFNRHDWPAMLGLLADDVVHEINEGDAEIGRDAFTKFMAVMDSAYDETASDIVVMTSADGTRAAAEFFIDGRYLLTQPGLPEARGQTYRLRVGAFFEFNAEGQISRVSNYYNLADWLRQVA